MLDFRYKTFLALCKIRSFTKTAEALNITQPAVSQHIKYLEDYYGGKLFCYENKQLYLTERGMELEKYAITVSADSNYIKDLLRTESFQRTHLSFGATLTIGEYVMPFILSKLGGEYPHMQVKMEVNNTETLLKKLAAGEISFAFIEGVFDKNQYGWKLFSKEKFIGVASNAERYAKVQDILDERLIVREKGSGTRDVLEQILAEQNLAISGFRGIWEVGNLQVIKDLVIEGKGPSFLYKVAVARELERGVLKELDIEGFRVEREFNFVYLKNSIHHVEYIKWYEYFKSIRTAKLSHI